MAVQAQASAPHGRPVRRLVRPRLLELLNAADVRAVVLCAPAGYGKTVLARQWLAERRAVWYTASPAAADVAGFAVALAQAASALVPGAAERVAERAPFAESPAEAAEALARALADDLAVWPEDAWLAVEDYHLVAESAAVEA